MEISKYYKYVLVGFAIIIAVISFLMLKPFITTLLSSVIIAYIFYPVYKKLKGLIKNETISSILTLIVIAILILGPLIFVTQTLARETYYIIKQGEIDKLTVLFHSLTEKYPALSTFITTQDVTEATKQITIYISEKVSSFLFSVPEKILYLFIMFFVMFYLFRDGEKIVAKIKKYSLMRRDHQKELISQFQEVTTAIIYGWFVAAIIQGIFGILGFWVFKVPHPVIWGIVMAILAMLPIIGTAIVWLPAALWLMYTNNFTFGIGLIIYGILVISTVDNVFKFLLIGKKTKMHLIVILLGIIGGLRVFGIIGIVIGPLILSWLLTFVKIYGIEKNI